MNVFNTAQKMAFSGRESSLSKQPFIDVSVKEMFQNISQNSKENTFDRANRVAELSLQFYYKKEFTAYNFTAFFSPDVLQIFFIKAILSNTFQSLHLKEKL